ncbi:MAG: hypothetical protein KAV82_14735, partial [Phycisphaerae bacterium]|nr:hypothetical protein [Phycisphaerae bacterium]
PAGCRRYNRLDGFTECLRFGITLPGTNATAQVGFYHVRLIYSSRADPTYKLVALLPCCLLPLASS